MTSENKVIFFLEENLRQSAEAGNHNFLGLVSDVLTEAGFQVAYADPQIADARDGQFALFHMQQPDRPKGVTVRRSYYYPFWQIERTSERWNWDVARAPFDRKHVDPNTAAQFFGFWQKRLFKDGPQSAANDGFIYVPLQGKLLQHRSFQHCSPMKMLDHVLAHSSGRKVIATLHPGETYSERELFALETLADATPNLTLQMGGMEPLLQRCAFVVTQNSSVAFAACFFRKPSILFAGIDFHHICANVSDLGVKAAFESVTTMEPDYAAYVWWFLQHRSINAGRPEAKDKIKQRLRDLGWPV
ncbi:hypothetical protein [Shimia sp. SDUM112013]|uniref:hypothetical protein n=1 Tax=Shimia sp. SDUM112013 TaxID=3136160 RepID=UPI0032EE10AD